MHWSSKIAGIFVLGICLVLAGCPKKSDTEQPCCKRATGKTEQEHVDSPEVVAALVLLQKNQGTYERNAAGTVVAVNLKLSTMLDPATQEDKDAGRPVADTEYNRSVGELFDAINTLVDLEKVAFDGPGIDDYGVLRLTNLKKVKTAHFKNANITTASLKMIAETMQDLTELAVNRCMKLDGSSISAIVNGMPKLKILNLQSNAFKTFDLRPLSTLAELEDLDLRQCTELQGEVLKYVANIPTLKVLRLRGAIYRDRSIENLAGHPALKVFFLQDASVSDDFLDSVVAIPTLVDLSMFRLLDISNDGMQKLENAKLQRLLIRENDLIDDEGIVVIKTMPDLSRLILYELRAVSDEGLIAAISGNKKLVNLALYDMDSITDESRKALATTTNLRSLELRKTGQTDETLKLVAKLPRLESIIIGDNSKFTDEGLASLGESKSLKTIEIKNITGITNKGIRDFKTKYPTIAIKATNEEQTE